MVTFQMRMATERNDLVARLAEAKEEYERVTQERGEADERMDADRKMISEIEKEVNSSSFCYYSQCHRRANWIC